MINASARYQFYFNKNGKTNFSFSFFVNLYADKAAVYSLPFALRYGQAICL